MKNVCNLPHYIYFFFGFKMEILYKIYQKEECMGTTLDTSGQSPQYLCKTFFNKMDKC